MREAGLIITSDLCPVTPGSYTRLHLVADYHVVRLGRPVISLLELDYPSRALAYSEGWGHCPFVSWLLRSLLKHTTARVCSRSVGVELWTREDTLYYGGASL
jgi:hypothetical protein